MKRVYRNFMMQHLSQQEKRPAFIRPAQDQPEIASPSNTVLFHTSAFMIGPLFIFRRLRFLPWCSMEIQVVWDVTLYRLENIYQRFGVYPEDVNTPPSETSVFTGHHGITSQKKFLSFYISQ
jgi:hypothetical protein